LFVFTGAVVDSMDKNGCTALHIAALYGHELLSGTLLTFQADPSKRGYEGTNTGHKLTVLPSAQIKQHK
jgi:ankyrin repeat protein